MESSLSKHRLVGTHWHWYAGVGVGVGIGDGSSGSEGFVINGNSDGVIDESTGAAVISSFDTLQHTMLSPEHPGSGLLR